MSDAPTPECGQDDARALPHALFDALPSALILLDAAGRVVFANTRAAAIFARAPQEMLGAPVERWLAPLPQLLAQVAGNEAGRLTTAAGVERPVGYRLAPVPRLAAPPGVAYALVFQDLSAIERLRDERDRLLRLAAVGEVLPAVLHEIKNPLAAISTSVEVLTEETPEGHVRRELQAVLSEVRRIKLALEGIGLFRNELHSTRRCAVDTALREAFLVLERQMTAKGVGGTLVCPRLPLLPFDAAVLRALLFNLVTNAVHACAAGDRITIRARAAEGDEGLELRVEDTGCGMSPETLARCRELFFTTKANGSGIGLALCAEVVRRAGGELAISSAPGQGTTVDVRIPAQAPQAPRPPHPTEGDVHVTH